MNALQMQNKNRPNMLFYVSVVIAYIISCIGFILFLFILGTVLAVSCVWDWVTNNKGV